MNEQPPMQPAVQPALTVDLPPGFAGRFQMRQHSVEIAGEDRAPLGKLSAAGVGVSQDRVTFADEMGPYAVEIEPAQPVLQDGRNGRSARGGASRNRWS